VVDHVRIHNLTIHNKRKEAMELTLMKGEWWGREVVTMGSDEEGKW